MGDLQHNSETTALSNTSPVVSPFSSQRHTRVLISTNQLAQVTAPANWESVKIALIKSIHKGVFFDRKYWARHSKTGDDLKPVYVSSVIMGDKAPQLNDCASKFGYVLFTEVLRFPVVKLLKGRYVLMNHPEGDTNVDSDCEDDPAGTSDEALKEQNEEEIRAVLIAGSFSACVRFLPHPPNTGGVTGYPAGNLFFSIAVQTRSRSLPSNRKVPTLC